MGRHLHGIGGAPEALLELGHRRFQSPYLGSVGAGERITGAEFVEDGAANPPHCKGGEGQPAFDVESLHRLQQTE